MTDDDIQDGAEELESLGLVRFHRHARCGPLGFDSIWPKDELFVELDAQMMDWNPEADALRIAADLVADSDGSANVQELAERYGWEPRRLNPAINYLEIHELAMVGKYPGTMPYTASGVRKTSATRRFVRDNS